MDIEADLKRFNKEKSTTAADWHAFWVYHDPEFIQENDDVNKACGVKLKTVGIWDNSLVPDNKLAEFQELQASLIERYRISQYQLDRFNSRPVVYAKQYNYNIESIELNDDGNFHIVVNPSITKDEMTKSWQALRKLVAIYGLEDKDTRRRPPDDTRLIYAIFKGQQRGLSYSKIFKLYQDGELPYYENGVTNQYSSADSLEDYFVHHRP